MLDGFNEGWIDSKHGEARERKGATDIRNGVDGVWFRVDADLRSARTRFVLGFRYFSNRAHLMERRQPSTLWPGSDNPSVLEFMDIDVWIVTFRFFAGKPMNGRLCVPVSSDRTTTCFRPGGFRQE